ncbi:limb region 1 homolog-like protein [Sinocyclocheilus grahami]|uniref:limb region 1 homolog-like protein n=1 Tax=Sinocyclocheilus grahami TaxID=75366 RepID=UPI0007ACA9C7|nr:PREDICTED: limb region 1 homolog-like protein [Sinocyclocheilus grahami]
METEDVTVREQLFHDRVRETIICVLLFICLYILSHFILTHFKKNAEFVTVTFHFHSVSVSGLWNLVFLFSNLSLVFLMPFAYFFTESEGFAGSKKGIMARVYETAVMLLLLSLLVLGIVWVASALIHHNTARESLYDLWEYYLPHLYSGISLFGVLLLLLCTPFGLSRMFSVTGSLLVKPRVVHVGITRFDLLGDFGRYNWLGSFHIVFLYNMLFAGLTSACLINTVTWALQRELIRAFGLHRLPLTVSRSTIPLKLLLANGLSKIH